MKDYEALGDLRKKKGYEDPDEQDLLCGLWLRASSLPRISDEQKTKDSSSGTCSRSLFNISSCQSKCGTKGKEMEGKLEMDQNKGIGIPSK